MDKYTTYRRKIESCLEEFQDRDAMSAQEWEVYFCAIKALMNLETTKAMRDEGEETSSRRMPYYPQYGMSYNMSYEGGRSYDGRSYDDGRSYGDSRRSYDNRRSYDDGRSYDDRSYHGSFADQLRDLMDKAPSESERKQIQDMLKNVR